MGPPGSVVGLAVALATLALTMQTPLMAFGVASLLLVPAIAIWMGVGVAALMSPRRTADSTALITGTVVLVFTAWVILLQFRLAPSSAGMPGGGRTLDPPPGTVVNPPPPMNAWPQRETPRSPVNEVAPQ